MLNNKSSEFTVPVDGSVLFVIDQLDYPDSRVAETLPVDLSSIPTLKSPPETSLPCSSALPMSLFRPVKFGPQGMVTLH